MQNFGEAKYLIHAQIKANGVVEKPDVVGAIFGQTEGLIGESSDLRELQKGGKVGRIKVDISSNDGRSNGEVLIPSSLNKIETAILAASLETIERIGPCKANIRVTDVEDVRETKRDRIVDRAKEILSNMFEETDMEDDEIAKTVKRSFGETGITSYKGLSSGPNVRSSDAILIVEGRSDVLNLLDYGIKNSIAIEGTDMPDQIEHICHNKTVTAFLDGDRGGDLILKELLQRADIDYVARAPKGKQVEELDHNEVLESLRKKKPVSEVKKDIRRGEKTEQKQKEIKSKEPETEKQTNEQGTVEPEKTKPEVKHKLSKQNNGKRSKILQKAKKGLKKAKKSRNKLKTKPNNQKQTTQQTQEIPETERETAQPEEMDQEPQTMRELYQETLQSVEGTLKAKMLDGNSEVVSEVAVRDLAKSIKEENGSVKTVIFDGVITQRLLDICSDKKVKKLVGVKIGNVSKKPSDVMALTKKDL
ncbi:DNA primase DnaG [Methanonatronarchaeum sp. AMET6-2]|uniref:DNA primase DnaG n=1 Tax=Methanonatronarchaeum sp. AMET6-2 TaxID=2933293 RepID=UPI0012181151|nr:DNA primase DnaG [Methanonatronarchaeum sp. AMET6-2]RZN60957.1 MAG: DNA primase [Methanonatronarchaeia archaeon]UOY10651.1 DNA primase DnaG [Methanonatronarchaeum sp. AMET6-2]